MKKYDYFEHTADIGIKAYGKNIEEAFENSALAITNIITKTENVSKNKRIKINVNAENIEALFYEWLEAIIIKFDTQKLVFSEFKVNIDKKNNKLRAICLGEKFNLEKHEIGSEIKAITYHQMEIKEKQGKWQINFVPDI